MSGLKDRNKLEDIVLMRELCGEANYARLRSMNIACVALHL